MVALWSRIPGTKVEVPVAEIEIVPEALNVEASSSKPQLLVPKENSGFPVPKPLTTFVAMMFVAVRVAPPKRTPALSPPGKVPPMQLEKLIVPFVAVMFALTLAARQLLPEGPVPPVQLLKLTLPVPKRVMRAPVLTPLTPVVPLPPVPERVIEAVDPAVPAEMVPPTTVLTPILPVPVPLPPPVPVIVIDP